MQKETSNKINLVEWFDDHFYKRTIDDEVYYYPSVTTKLGIIAKHGIDRWRGDIGNREADLRIYDAQNKGKRIHKAWETVCNGGVVYYKNAPNDVKSNYFVLQDQDEMLAVHKLQLFVKTLNPVLVYAEKEVFSDTRQEAGTMDNLFYIEEGEYLISGKNPVKLTTGYYVADLKSGKDIYDEAYFQVAAYAAFCVEMKLVEKIEGALILHTNAKIKNGIEGFSAKHVSRDELLDYYNTYTVAAELWSRKNKNFSPYLATFPQEIKIEFKKG